MEVNNNIRVSRSSRASRRTRDASPRAAPSSSRRNRRSSPRPASPQRSSPRRPLGRSDSMASNVSNASSLFDRQESFSHDWPRRETPARDTEPRRRRVRFDVPLTETFRRRTSSGLSAEAEPRWPRGLRRRPSYSGGSTHATTSPTYYSSRRAYSPRSYSSRISRRTLSRESTGSSLDDGARDMARQISATASRLGARAEIVRYRLREPRVRLHDRESR